MSTLIFQLFSAMQSWGKEDKFSIYSTNREPSKSAVIGLIAAAMGIQEHEQSEFDELNKLRFAVRCDCPGSVMSDYHTAAGDVSIFHLVKKQRGKKVKYEAKPAAYMKSGRRESEITYREYLTDAFFTVGLEGDVALLQRAAVAFSKPKFFLYLGRKSCPLTFPIMPKLVESPLLDAVMTFPTVKRNEILPMRIFFDASEGEIRRDVFAGMHGNTRMYHIRFVKSLVCDPPKETFTFGFGG